MEVNANPSLNVYTERELPSGDIEQTLSEIDGSPLLFTLAIDTLLNSPYPPSAIVEAFYPGARGAAAISQGLYGVENRWGRLPYSIMNTEFGNDVAMTDMSMAQRNQPPFPVTHTRTTRDRSHLRVSCFRSYRYADPKYVLFPFGSGRAVASLARRGLLSLPSNRQPF